MLLYSRRCCGCFGGCGNCRIQGFSRCVCIASLNWPRDVAPVPRFAGARITWRYAEKSKKSRGIANTLVEWRASRAPSPLCKKSAAKLSSFGGASLDELCLVQDDAFPKNRRKWRRNDVARSHAVPCTAVLARRIDISHILLQDFVRCDDNVKRSVQHLRRGWISS